MDKMEKLKIGDRVVYIRHDNWGRNKYYTFDTVVRLTKTQAILSNGVRLINEPKRDFSGNLFFNQFGNDYSTWRLETVEMLEESKIEKMRQIIKEWFKNRTFTDAEKAIIYKTFNNGK